MNTNQQTPAFLNDMDELAMGLVRKYIDEHRKYIDEHLDKSEPAPNYGVFTVWKSKVLQNWKYLISSTPSDGKYYELTYNGDKQEWYLDCYIKLENRCIVLD